MLIGFAAQLVDGSMGMGYGVTSSTLLLLAGFAPAVASASIHLAEVTTSVVSGIAHGRLGNVDRRMALLLALPGAAGAFVGATLLASLPADRVKPWVSAVLLALGFSILLRYARRRAPAATAPPGPLFLIGLGLGGGLLDAIGGGGWGPVVTTTLLARSAVLPRLVIGSVSLSEIAVAVAATAGFALTMGWETFAWQWVVALMAGGVVAAPVAAWTVRRVQRSTLGVMVGGTILLTNARYLLAWAGAAPLAAWAAYLAVGALTLTTLLSVRRSRRSPRVPLASPLDGGRRVAGEPVTARDRLAVGP